MYECQDIIWSSYQKAFLRHSKKNTPKSIYQLIQIEIFISDISSVKTFLIKCWLFFVNAKGSPLQRDIFAPISKV